MNGDVSANFARWGPPEGWARLWLSPAADALTVEVEATGEVLYELEFSTNFGDWETLLFNQQGDASYLETDPPRLSGGRRYYRATRD